MAKEIATAVALKGDAAELEVKIAEALAKDFDFYARSGESAFPLLSIDKENARRISVDQDKFAQEAYIEDGLVLPDGIDVITFTAPVSHGDFIQDDKVEVLLTPGDVAGLYVATTTATYEDGLTESNEKMVFLDGKKVGRATGSRYEEVEHGIVGKDEVIELTDSKIRPGAVVEKEEVKEEDMTKKQKAKKSLIQRNIDAGYENHIKDAGTGFNRVYMKVFNGDYKHLKDRDLFPRDFNSACPVLADSRNALGETQFLRIELANDEVRADYVPAALELNLENYMNQYRAYGPALTRDSVQGHPDEGSVYYMNVTKLSDDEMMNLEEKVIDTIDSFEGRANKQELIDAILQTTLDAGAEPPILALGKAFDETVRDKEAKQLQAELDAVAAKDKARAEMLRRNAEIKEEVSNLRRTGQPIPREYRDRIFVEPGILVPPNKEAGQTYYTIPVKSGYKEMEIRIERRSEALGSDGKPLTYVKPCRDQYDHPGAFNIMVSGKLGKQFTAYIDGVEVGAVNYSALNNFIDDKNKKIRQERDEDRTNKVVRRQMIAPRMIDTSVKKKGNLRYRGNKKGADMGNPGTGDKSDEGR